MAAMKSMVMTVMDCGASMADKIGPPGNRISKFELARSIATTFTLQRMLATKTMEISLVSYNGAGAEVHLDFGRPAASTLRIYNDLTVGTKTGNMYAGLQQGAVCLMDANKGKKFNRIMILLTDGTSQLSQDEAQELGAQFRNDGIIFYVVLVQDRPVANVEHLQAVVDQCEGGVCSVADLGSGLKFLSGGIGLNTRPMQMKTVFELSPEVRIPCVYWGKVSKSGLPTLKKQAPSYDPEDPDSGKVGTVRLYRNPNDLDEELAIDERVKGYKYGGQYIPLGGLEDDALKLPSPPCIRLLGFFSLDKVPRHHFLEATIVLDSNGEDASTAALGALCVAMHQRKQAALVRFVKRENSDPWLGVLIPPSHYNGSLLLHRVPCAEDIRDFQFPDLDVDSVPAAQQTAMSAYVDAVTLPQATSDNLTIYNPAMLSLLLNIQRKVVNDKVVAKADIPETPAADCKSLQDNFPLTAVDQEKRKERKAHWADIDITMSDDAAAPVEEAPVAADIPLPPPLNMGVVNAVEEFNEIFSDKYPLENPVQLESIDTMMKIIETLVTFGGTNAHYKKAVSCLKALRSGCILCRQIEKFNTYMRQNIKGQFAVGRHGRMWEIVCDEGITLISTLENPQSGVSVDEAAAFVKAEEVIAPPVVSQVMTVNDEEEDLFGMMA